VLGKFHDTKLRRTRNAFVTPAIVKHEQPNIRVVGLDLLTATGNDDLNDLVVNYALQEDVFHESVRRHSFAIDDGLIGPEYRESSWLDAGEIRFATRLSANAVDGDQRAWTRSIASQPTPRTNGTINQVRGR
jgi:hypothetical protein